MKRNLFEMHFARIAAWILTLVMALIVGVLTLTPAPDVGLSGGTDKVYHFLAFAALALPLSTVYPRAFIHIALAFIAYGISIELIQPYVGRAFEFGDIIADGAGCLFGCALGKGLNSTTLKPE